MGLEFIDGNQAIVRGAIKAGCGFFAGYPITPASTILQYMLDQLPRSGNGFSHQGCGRGYPVLSLGDLRWLAGDCLKPCYGGASL